MALDLPTGADSRRPGDERTVRLLDHDPDLGASLRPERLAEARLTALANTIALPRGPLDPATLSHHGQMPYGVLVLDGLIGRSVRLRETSATQLLGRSDLVTLEGTEAGARLVPVETAFTVLEPATVALLDDRFLLAVRRWPEIVAALFERLATQSARVATHLAISQLPRVEDRLQMLFWFLAERWGRMTPQGVIVPLKLTHDTLGRLIGARRPTVSLAVKELEARGAVHRRADGAWLLEQAEAVALSDDPDGLMPPRFVVERGFAVPGDGEPAIAADPAARPSAAARRGGDAAQAEHADLRAMSGPLRGRIERMRRVHAKARDDVSEMLLRAELTRRRSRALRENVSRGSPE